MGLELQLQHNADSHRILELHADLAPQIQRTVHLRSDKIDKDDDNSIDNSNEK